MSGFSNKPKILRGAFVEYGLSRPRLFVVFQFNPVQLTRNRSLTFAASSSAQTRGQGGSLRDFHKQEKYKDLTKLQKEQNVAVGEETIGFQLRLDASDPLNNGDTSTGQFSTGQFGTNQLGIEPQLSTLELMVHPKEESLLGGEESGFSFTHQSNPPLVLFIWGRKRVLPVNINSLNITEILYSTDLTPLRATADVRLTVIEGQSPPYLSSKAMKEAMSGLNLANLRNNTNVVIPG